MRALAPPGIKKKKEEEETRDARIKTFSLSGLGHRAHASFQQQQLSKVISGGSRGGHVAPPA